MTDLFVRRPRDDHAAMRPNEGTFQFLNRSARPLFGRVRRLLTKWVADLPEEVRRDLVPRLRSNDQQTFESAFWELYLYTAYVGSGYRLTVHPKVYESTKHPDFMVDGKGTRFYLEAVRVGTTATELAEEHRLQEVEAALARLRSDRFVLSLLHLAVGPNPLPTRPLRAALKAWLDGLASDSVVADLSHGSIFERAPKFTWNHEGWRLGFQAIPRRTQAFSQDQSLVGMSGPGQAQLVDNISGLLRVLDDKANRYGSLDHPLVIAVMSNTDSPTEDYEFEQALFGRAVGRGVESTRDPSMVVEDGHWLTRRGWRRGHAPQVIAASNLTPWTITQSRPRLWTTLETSVVAPSQPNWLMHVSVVGNQSSEVSSLEALFGLPPDWGAYEF